MNWPNVIFKTGICYAYIGVGFIVLGLVFIVSAIVLEYIIKSP